jgi:hypothetical protein
MYHWYYDKKKYTFIRVGTYIKIMYNMYNVKNV